MLAFTATIWAAAAHAQPAGVQPPVSLPSAQAAPRNVAVTTLFPGGGSPPPLDPIARIYQNNPQYINEGRRLFSWYNCVGCHANGGGGMGPALMDNLWRYGGRLDQIYSSISQGRPNGMPHWGTKIPDSQIWALAAFVRSLSVPTPANAGNAAPHEPPPETGLPRPPQSAAPGVQTTPK
ncbi:MAG TPA: c-type cytochrome [Stellaceae bacterium]|nr:c-type cytochrome [Stellaceae bacterium]